MADTVPTLEEQVANGVCTERELELFKKYEQCKAPMLAAINAYNTAADAYVAEKTYDADATRMCQKMRGSSVVTLQTAELCIVGVYALALAVGVYSGYEYLWWHHPLEAAVHGMFVAMILGVVSMTGLYCTLHGRIDYSSRYTHSLIKSKTAVFESAGYGRHARSSISMYLSNKLFGVTAVFAASLAAVGCVKFGLIYGLFFCSWAVPVSFLIHALSV